MQKLRFEIGVNYNLSKLQGEKVPQIPNDHIFLQVMPSPQVRFCSKTMTVIQGTERLEEMRVKWFECLCVCSSRKSAKVHCGEGD